MVPATTARVVLIVLAAIHSGFEKDAQSRVIQGVVAGIGFLGAGTILKVGERVAAGEPLAVLHANDETRLAEARALMAEAFTLGDVPIVPPPLVAEVIGD